MLPVVNHVSKEMQSIHSDAVIGESNSNWEKRAGNGERGKGKKEVTGGQSYYYNNIIITVVEKGKVRGG